MRIERATILRFSLRSALVTIATFCIAIGIASGIHRSSIARTQREEQLTIDLMMSFDTVHFLPNGKVGLIDKAFAVFEGDDKVAPIGFCRVCSGGVRNSFDYEVLNKFSALTFLELYQCDLSDEQWDDISCNSTIETLLLSAGTSVSDHGRQVLERAGINVVDSGS